MFERFHKPASPLDAVHAHYGAIQTATAHAAPRIPKLVPPADPVLPHGDPLAIVTAMVDLGCVFVPGRCPNSGSPMWVYRVAPEHAADCAALAAGITYGEFVAAIHRLPPGSIKPEPLAPPPRI